MMLSVKRWWRYAIVVVLASCGGQALESSSNQTQPLSCNATADCARLGDRYVCRSHQCRVVVEEDSGVIVLDSGMGADFDAGSVPNESAGSPGIIDAGEATEDIGDAGETIDGTVEGGMSQGLCEQAVCTEAHPCQEVTTPLPGYICRGQFADWTPLDVPNTLTDNQDGTVTDSRTGLTWQQTVRPEQSNLADAKAYCADLSLAGTGWRVPARAELESIIDFGRYDPSFDPTFFPNTPDERFWSVSPDVGAPGNSWIVFARFGYSTAISDTGPAMVVRCVRSNESAFASDGPGGTPPGRYTIHADQGIVKDERTGLTWQRDIDMNIYTRPEAADLCAALDLAGATNWRLPTISELLTLVDPTRWNPAIDAETFPNTPSAPDTFYDPELNNPPFSYFGTSSVSVVGPSDATWSVDFYTGYSEFRLFPEKTRVRCVH